MVTRYVPREAGLTQLPDGVCSKYARFPGHDLVRPRSSLTGASGHGKVGYNVNCARGPCGEPGSALPSGKPLRFPKQRWLYRVLSLFFPVSNLFLLKP